MQYKHFTKVMRYTDSKQVCPHTGKTNQFFKTLHTPSLAGKPLQSAHDDDDVFPLVESHSLVRPERWPQISIHVS